MQFGTFVMLASILLLIAIILSIFLSYQNSGLRENVENLIKNNTDLEQKYVEKRTGKIKYKTLYNELKKKK